MRLRQARKLDRRRSRMRLCSEIPWTVGTLLRAVRRLRAAWRRRAAYDPAGWRGITLDFYAGNRLATCAHVRAHLLAQRRGHADLWPTPYHDAEVHGQRRSLG